MPRPRLYWQFFLPFAISLLLVTLLAWLLASHLLAGAHESRLQGQLDAAAALLAEQRLPFTPELLGRIAALLGVGLVLFDRDGQPVFATDLGGTRVNALLPANYRDWLRRPPRATGIEFRSGGATYRATLRRLDNRDDRYGAVAAIGSLADLEAAALRGAWTLAAAALAALALLAWIGHRTARAITVPVAAMAELAGRIADGERDARVEVERDDEIGRLAKAINRMAEHLVGHERELAAGSRQAAFGQLAARVAHEVRNPLTALHLQLELLAERVPEAQRETVRNLLVEVRRLDLIVSGTLAVAAERPAAPVETALNPLLQAVCDLLKPQFAHRRVVLQTALAAGLPTLAIDPDRTRQVLLNLLVNAADALVEGGNVRVTSRLEAAHLVVEVEDDGPGIDPALADRLFEPSVSGKPGGLGIGLALSRELVVAQGGTLTAGRGEALGGARFRMTLPLTGSPA